MTIIDGISLAALLGLFGFMWKLHTDINGLTKDVGALGQRLARIEGWIEGRFNQAA